MDKKCFLCKHIKHMGRNKLKCVCEKANIEDEKRVMTVNESFDRNCDNMFVHIDPTDNNNKIHFYR